MIFLFAVWFHANLNVVHVTLLCCIPKKGGLVEVEMLVQEDGWHPNGMSMKPYGGPFCITGPLRGETHTKTIHYHPQNYAYPGPHFRCCINCIVARYRLISSISVRVTSVTSPDLGQSYVRPSVRDATPQNMDKWITMNTYIYIYMQNKTVYCGVYSSIQCHRPLRQSLDRNLCKDNNWFNDNTLRLLTIMTSELFRFFFIKSKTSGVEIEFTVDQR